MSSMVAVSWSDVEALSERLADATRGERFDAILGLLRGGLVPACLLSQRLGIRPVLAAAVSSYSGRSRGLLTFSQFPHSRSLREKRVLVVDDIWDSGRTAMAVRERLRRSGIASAVAVLHYKPESSHFPDQRPDYFAATTSEWIVYPWEAASAAAGVASVGTD